jgi:hypothetical protein
MPLQKCEGDGWKWGESGKCYHGPGAREKAKKQGRAIERNKHMEESKESPRDLLDLHLREDGVDSE